MAVNWKLLVPSTLGSDRTTESCASPGFLLYVTVGNEVGVDVTVPDAAQGRPAALSAADADRAHTEQRHVLHDVLPTEQAQLATGEDLRPVLEADRQVHLTHVDLGTCRVDAEVIVGGAGVDLRRESEVYAQIQPGF